METFGLNWNGKAKMLENLNLMPEQFFNQQTSLDFEHLLIKGDNALALKALQKDFRGKINCIITDPPYNTGNSFVYKDNFRSKSDNQSYSAQMQTLHSGWLDFIYPRLFLAKELLAEDGVIFVCIDDSELHNLRLLMDEIFGPYNFLGTLIWNSTSANNAKYISTGHEYIVCFAKNKRFLDKKSQPWRVKKDGLEEVYNQAKKLLKEYDNNFESASKAMQRWWGTLDKNNPLLFHKNYRWIDKKGVYYASDMSPPGGKGHKYSVEHPKTKKMTPPPSRGWSMPEQEFQRLQKENLVHWGPDETKQPLKKTYLHQTENWAMRSVFYQPRRAASTRLDKLLAGKVFEYPKDEFVMQKLVGVSTEKDGLILDFFAGSGSTAHGVILQNHLDGGTRKSISIQLPVDCPPKSVAKIKGFVTISDITKARIEKVFQNHIVVWDI